MDITNQICRACLCTGNSFTYFLLQNVPRELFWFCTSVDVGQTDDLPKAICNSCYELIQKFAQFKRTCICSNEKLINIKVSAISHSKTESQNAPVKAELPIDIKLEQKDCNDCHSDDSSSSDYILDSSLIKSEEQLSLTSAPPDNNVKKKRNRKIYPYECDICHKKLSTVETFHAHKLLHEGKTAVIECKLCDKKFTRWQTLTRHNENYHAQLCMESLKCSLCGKVTSSPQALRAHELKHNKAPEVPICHICGGEFKTIVILKSHLKTHQIRVRSVKCEHCDQKFYNRAASKQHQRRCHTQTRYICDWCGNSYKDKNNLRWHLQRHEGLAFHCSICDKPFGKKHYLKEHMLIHTGEKPFECDICRKKFRNKRFLVEHRRTHTGEKPNKCHLCSQAFAQRGSLSRHLKIHDKH